LLWSRAAAAPLAWLPGSSLLTVTWPLSPAVAEDSSRVWVERSTRPSGSNLSEVWVTLL
jgi:hypothetical protein